jgi:hypothetical protein
LTLAAKAGPPKSDFIFNNAITNKMEGLIVSAEPQYRVQCGFKTRQ